MQRQEDNNQNPPSNQDSEEKSDNKKISTTHQLSQFQWNGERITLRFYIQKWYDLLEDSKDKKALKVLQQLVPPTYRDIVQNSSSLKKCLKYLATYCTNEDMHSKITRDRARKRKCPERNGSRKL